MRLKTSTKVETREIACLRFADIRLPGAVRLRYTWQGPANGEPIVLLHGYADSWFSFSRILPLLPADWRVLAPDQRGHGDSDRSARTCTPDDFANDVLDLMDATGIDSATLVGHSMGSFVARRVAALAPGRVRSLVLSGSAATARNSVLLKLAEVVKVLADPVDEHFVRELLMSNIYRPLPADFLSYAIAVSRRMPARIWKSALLELIRGGAAWELPGISCPTLVMCGERDRVFSRAEHEELVGRIRGAILRINPNAGHAWHWEEPENFVRELMAFAGGARVSVGAPADILRVVAR